MNKEEFTKNLINTFSHEDLAGMYYSSYDREMQLKKKNQNLISDRQKYLDLNLKLAKENAELRMEIKANKDDANKIAEDIARSLRLC